MFIRFKISDYVRLLVSVNHFFFFCNILKLFFSKHDGYRKLFKHFDVMIVVLHLTLMLHIFNCHQLSAHGQNSAKRSLCLVHNASLILYMEITYFKFM